MGIFGIAKRGFGKALKAYKSRQRAKRIAKGERGPTIKGVKPFSGKIPKYISGSPKRRAEQVKEGKAGLKKMVDTGQAEEYKNLPGQHKKKGFK